MNILLFIPLLFLFGCAPLNEPLTHSYRYDNEPSKYVGGFKGLDDMAKILEAKLKDGKNVNLAISVDAETLQDGDSEFRKDLNVKMTSSVFMYKDFRDYFKNYNNFNLVDTDGLDDLKKANYLLTMHVRYSKYGEWSGKLISLTNNETIGEYICLYIEGNKDATCH